MTTRPDDLGIDLFTTFTLLGAAGDRMATNSLVDAGYRGLRPSHGFLIGMLRDGPRTIGEMAPRLRVTQQAVSKTVRELSAAGYVEQLADGSDRRRRPVALTERGRTAIAQSERARAELAGELEGLVGTEQMHTVVNTLSRFLEQLGISKQLRERGVPTPELSGAELG